MAKIMHIDLDASTPFICEAYMEYTQARVYYSHERPVLMWFTINHRCMFLEEYLELMYGIKCRCYTCSKAELPLTYRIMTNEDGYIKLIMVMSNV